MNTLYNQVHIGYKIILEHLTSGLHYNGIFPSKALEIPKICTKLPTCIILWSHSPAKPRTILHTIFHTHFISDENIYYCIQFLSHQISTKFCTCHDSTAVVACAKFCSDPFIIILVTTKYDIQEIVNVREKLLVWWACDFMDLLGANDRWSIRD